MLSVIMPSFRLAPVIEQNVLRTIDIVSGAFRRFEIIPVDDGSRDGTDEILRSLGESRGAVVKPVLLEKNHGKGNALLAGFEKSSGDLVLLLDADLDLSPEMLPKFLSVMEEEKADIVIGSKRHPDSVIDYPLSRRIASFFYYSFVRVLTGLPVTDTQTGMKLFRRSALEYAFGRMLVKRYAFDVEILSIAHNKGFRVAEAPVKMEYGKKPGALTFQNAKTVFFDTLAIFYRLKIIRYYQSVSPVECKSLPSVSVVIAAPDITGCLSESLEGLARQSVKPDEVIILPDFSPRSGVDPENYGLNLKIVPTGRTRPAQKRNLAIPMAKGEIIAFLDDDARPDEKWLEKSLRHFSSERIGAAGGPQLTPPSDPPMAAAGGDVFASPVVSGSYRYRYVQERYRKVDDLPSCNLLVRKSILEKLGGYNTKYWPGEDTILCRDIVAAGHEIMYDPFAVVYHHRRRLFLPHLRQVGRYALHRGFFARKFPQNSRRLSYMVPSLFVAGLLIGALASAAYAPISCLYLGCVAIYLAIAAVFSVRPGIKRSLAVFSGTVLTHLWYGIRFIQGFLSRSMPEKAAPFDHFAGNGGNPRSA